MSALRSPPDKTFAIIVGISRYDGIAALRGPAAEARQFASWLISRGVPRKNIVLFLSPLDATEHTPECEGVHVADARSGMRSELMNRFKNVAGEHLIFFWGGHGVIDVRENERVLAFADARSGDVPCLKVADLLAYFRGADVTGFPEQTFIIDACASYFGSMPRTKELSIIGMPHHEPVPGRRQMWLFSADDGQGATNRSDSGGLFTKYLLNELERTDAAVWPPDFDLVGRRSIEAFEALKNAGMTAQMPGIFVHKPHQGTGTTIHGGLTDTQRAFRRECQRFRTLYESVFDRVDVAHFTGRDWLSVELNEFLARNDRGVFALEANAGLGKSAAMAHLAHTMQWPHHFVELTPGVGGIGDGLRSLALQLIDQWNLVSFQDEPVESSPAAFLEILTAACQARNQQRPGEKIVILIDALDESARASNGNFMGLPNSLPAGAYLVVSHRPVDIALHVQGPFKVFTYGAESKDNMTDMRNFIARVALDPVVAQVLRNSGYSDEEFVEGLATRCGGLWIYLKYIIVDIRRGKWQPLEMPNLPNGIWQYYAEHCKERSLDSDWAGLQLPVLCTLAVVQEDIALGLLCDMAGVSDHAEVKRLLADRWQPFLVVSDNSERHYRMYHASLREFLEGRIDREEYTQSQRNLVDDLAETTRLAHARVAKRYLDAWGGIESELARLGAGNDSLRLDGGYGYRHVLTHLQGAKDFHSQRAVLTAQRKLVSRQPKVRPPGWRGWWERLRYPTSTYEQITWQNVWYETHRADGNIAGYLAGIARVWRGAEERTAAALKRGERAGSIATEIWCALVSATVTSFADNVRPALLKALLKERILSPEQGLTLAQKTSRSALRTASLIYVAEHHEGRAKERILQQALNNFSTPAQEDRLSQEVLDALHPDLPIWFQTRLVEVVSQNPESSYRITTGKLPERLALDPARLLINNCVQRREHSYPAALVIAGAGGALTVDQATELLARHKLDREWRLALVRFLDLAQQYDLIHQLCAKPEHVAWPLLALTKKHLSPIVSSMVSMTALDRARRESLSSSRLQELISVMDGRELTTFLEHVTRAFSRDSSSYFKGYIAIRFAELGDTRRALKLLKGLSLYESSSADAYATVTPRLPLEDRLQLAEVVLSRDWPPWKARAVEGVIADLTPQQLIEIQRMLEEIKDEWSITRALSRIAPALIGTSHETVVLNWARDLSISRGYAYSKLAARLSPAQRAEIYASAHQLRDPDDKAESYVGLARTNDAALASSAARSAVAVIKSAGPSYYRSQALAELAAGLHGAEREPALDLCIDHIESLINNWGTQYAAERMVALLAPDLDETRTRRLALIAAGIDDQYLRRAIAQSIASRVPEHRLCELINHYPTPALLRALALDHPTARAEALEALLSEVEEFYRRAVETTVRDIRESKPAPSSIEEALQVLEECSSYRALKVQLLAASPSRRTTAIERAQRIVEQSSNPALSSDFRREFLPEQADWCGPEVIRSMGEFGLRFTPEAARKHLGDRWPRNIPGECLPDEVLVDALKVSLSQGEIDSNVVSRVCKLPAAELHTLWKASLQTSASGSRETLCNNLAAMTPIIHKLGGDDAVLETCRHIENVMRWWP